MSIPPDGDLNSNASDFDQSDEDLASLLADDDEDILKKTFSASPSKKKSENSEILRKDSKVDLQSPLQSKSSPRKTLTKAHSKEILDQDSDSLDDILSDTALPSSLKKSSPVQQKPKETASDDKEADALTSLGTNKKSSAKSKDSFFDSFFKNLSSPKDSPEKTPAASSPLDTKVKGKVKDDDDEDILSSLKSEDKISSQKRKDSYFDSFLKDISPKASPKKSLADDQGRRKSIVETKDDTDDDDDDEDLLKALESDEEKSPTRKDSYVDDYLKKSSSSKTSPKKSAVLEKKQDENKIALESDDEDIFGKTSSLETKKSTPSLPKHSTPDKRKTFTKQVSFKGIPDTSPDNHSPVKDKASPRNSLTSESLAKPKPAKRLERMGASNKEDTDWLSFFKESPKKTKKPNEPQMMTKNVSDDKAKAPNVRSLADRRRSSGGEWLGLSESDLADKDTDIKFKGTGDAGLGVQEKVIRPRTTPELSSRKKLLDDPDLSWLGGNNGIMGGQSRKVDDSDQLKLENERFEVARNATEHDKTYNLDVDYKSENLPHFGNTSEKQQHFSKQDKAHRTPNMLHSTPVGAESQLSTKVSSDVSAVRSLPTGLEQSYSLTDPQTTALSFQAVINNHILEKDQLVKSSEALKQMYEERIKTIESLHKNEVESYKESIKVLENKLKSEMDIQLGSKEAKLNMLQSEKKQIEKSFWDKLEESEKDKLKEIERLKELHNQSIALMKQDHEEALLRLKRLKEQEIEAVLSTQTQTKSLQHLTEQMEARASELASLQSKVEERNQATLREKQALLEAKERDLKNLQSRVERQLEDGDSERTRLQQLVLRLESRLQKYTAEGEEDRWEVQQMKARLSVQQKHLDEEYKLQLQQVEREKEKLRLAQDSLLHEQKTVLMQLAQERQQLMHEKLDMESMTKKLKEEQNIFHVKRMKEESFLESQKQFIQQEENRLRFEKNNIKQEAEMVERERESLQRERHLLNEEKLKINEFNFKLKRRETEVEMMAMSGAEDKDRAQVEHALALKIKNEQQSRMQQISQKLQEVMEKEQQILNEKEKLSEERLDLENKKKTIVCNKCKLSLGLPVNAPPQSIGPLAVRAPIENFHISNGVSNNLEAFRHDPSLVVWYITAQRDREYLQEELAFLKSLKDSSTSRKRT